MLGQEADGVAGGGVAFLDGGGVGGGGLDADEAVWMALRTLGELPLVE